MTVCLKRVRGFEYSDPIDMKKKLSVKESNLKSLHSLVDTTIQKEIISEKKLTFFF